MTLGYKIALGLLVAVVAVQTLAINALWKETAETKHEVALCTVRSHNLAERFEAVRANSNRAGLRAHSATTSVDALRQDIAYLREVVRINTDYIDDLARKIEELEKPKKRKKK